MSILPIRRYRVSRHDVELTQAVRIGPSAEVIMQALVAVRQMNVLFGAANKGSRNLVSLLKDKKRQTNVIIGGAVGVGAVVAVCAAGVTFGPPALGAALCSWLASLGASAEVLAAAGVLGRGVGVVGGAVAGLGAGALTWRKFWDGARFEKSELCRADTTPFHHADRCI